MPYLLKDAGAENVLKSGKFFLVVDEAHHTPAESYKKIFNLLLILINKFLLVITHSVTNLWQG